MSDLASVEAWATKFDAWKAEALPRMAKGETKEAFASYPWFQTEGDPFTRLTKPASETRFALITTGGYSIAGEQEPMKPIPNFGGDAPQIREIPIDVDPSKLEINHPGYDHRFAKEDINVNLPLDRLREMAAAGEIGSLSNTTHVFMGLVVDVAPMLRETISSLVEKLRADDVEAVLLVPS